MNKLKYIVILAISCLAFMFIDDVSALGNTSRVSLHLIGTSKYSLYREDTLIKGPSDFSFKSMFGTSFSHYGFQDTSYGYIYSSFLEWRVPVEIVKGYDKVSFTLGSSWSYFNNASFTTGKGWIACQSLSLPPTTTTFEGGFTSFVCDIDQTSVPETGEVTLYLNATLSRLLNASNSSGASVSYGVYYQNDVVFYTNDATTIENSIKEQTDAINKQTESIDKVDESINNSDTSGAQSGANDFFNGFEDKDYGFSDVIKMPLQMINQLTSSTCVPLSFEAPFVNQKITLPCMTQIYQTHFSSFLTVWQTISFGIVAYWVCMNLFAMVKNFKNPDNDEIEVFDL